jgi:hypothetical protein
VRFASLTAPYGACEGEEEYVTELKKRVLITGFRKYGRGFPWHAGCLNDRSLSGCIGGTGVPPVISSWTGRMPAPLNSQAQAPQRRHRICEKVYQAGASELHFPACAQLHREQSRVEVGMNGSGGTDFCTEAHDRSALVIQFRRTSVHDVPLHGSGGFSRE